MQCCLLYCWCALHNKKLYTSLNASPRLNYPAVIALYANAKLYAPIRYIILKPRLHRAGITTAARVNLTHPHLVNSTITESTSQWFCSLFPLLKIFLCFSFSFTVHKSHQGYISIYKWKPESVLGHSVGKQLPTFFCLFVCFFQINNILHKKGKGLLADSMHIFAIPIPTLYLSIHPFIYLSIQPAMSLIWVQVTRQHYKQSPILYFNQGETPRHSQGGWET